MGQATLRSALSKMKPKERDRALATFRQIYERRRAKNPGDKRYPELLGLRIYNATWKVKSFAKNRDKPTKRLLESRRLVSPKLLAELEAQAASAPVRVAKADIVLDLSSENDADGVQFEAPPGRYYLWLRGTSLGGTKHDSVKLHLDGKALKPRHEKAFGNWRSRFPRGAYAWSSESPDYPATRITLEGKGPHQLRLSGGKGEVKVDQIWLSQKQKDWPAFTAPVVRRGKP
jgi:hypothetical protein